MATKNKHLKPHQLGTLQRGKPARAQRLKILIVCEGQNTEPSYFEQFKVATAVIEIVGTGRNTLSLVEYAAHLHQTKYQNFNQVWCVFDADPKGDKYITFQDN
jgi:RloB-like protein